jgi:hypothetical protein
MQCRQLSYVAEFTTEIRHVPGVDNVVADTLSRPPSHTAGPDSCSHAAAGVSIDTEGCILFFSAASAR